MGKESSLSNAENMNIRGGVSITQFAPMKINKKEVKDESDEESVASENLTFE